MDVITTEPTLVHAAFAALTLPEVAAWRDRTIPNLLNDAEAAGLVATGPWTFVSDHLPQDDTTPFQLTICRPIASGGDYEGEFQIVELPAITAGHAHYEGPLSGIYQAAYAPLLEELLTSETPLSGEVREIYHVLADPASADNKVDILIAVAPLVQPVDDVIEVKDGELNPATDV